MNRNKRLYQKWLLNILHIPAMLMTTYSNTHGTLYLWGFLKFWKKWDYCSSRPIMFMLFHSSLSDHQLILSGMSIFLLQLHKQMKFLFIFYVLYNGDLTSRGESQRRKPESKATTANNIGFVITSYLWVR